MICCVLNQSIKKKAATTIGVVDTIAIGARIANGSACLVEGSYIASISVGRTCLKCESLVFGLVLVVIADPRFTDWADVESPYSVDN